MQQMITPPTVWRLRGESEKTHFLNTIFFTGAAIPTVSDKEKSAFGGK